MSHGSCGDEGWGGGMSIEMSVEVAWPQVDLPREAPSWAYTGAGRSRNSSV